MQKIAQMVLLLALVACGTTTPVERYVDDLTAWAAEQEPAVTTQLKGIAKEMKGDLFKLQYRLKTKKSMTRKVKKILHENPGLALADLNIDDSLRYTLLFDDQPPGHVVASIRETLRRFEAKGHQVVKVKNYWPPKDNYSGVNSVLRHPTGELWELQFHTRKSVEVNTANRHMYEELRKVDTPIERKQALFDQMATAWDAVPIPEGILEQGALHATDQVKARRRP